jgi:hypothetical protein
MTRLSVAAAILFAAASLAAAPKLTEQEARGKQIYLHGESRNGKPITALMGDGGVEVPATIVPCASCHGTDARGRDEAGVRPSNLRWDVLTRPYDAPGQRTHPPYTRAAVKRAVTMGLDPAGHKLQSAMPKYRMSLAQMDDLIAYLQKLPQDSDPGLTDDSIRLGIVVSNPAARSLVETYLSRVNQSGGLFGRKIDLRFTPSLTQAFIDTSHPFAIAASSLIGNEEEFESLIDQNQLPSMATIATREPKSRYSFHVLAGIREQAIALAQYAAKRGAQHPSLVVADGSPWREIAEGTKLPGCQVAELPKCFGDTLQPNNPAPQQPLNPATRQLGNSATQTPDALIVLGPESIQREILRKASIANDPPLVLIPGAIATSFDDLSASLDHRAAIAIPFLPSDAPPALNGALISTQLLIESLRRTGRDLGREKLIDTLEGFYNVDSELTSKITFGPNRHTGTNAVHILVWSAKEKTFVDNDGAVQ